MQEPKSLTHLDAQGAARMVDVSTKPPTARWARARATVEMARETAAAIREARLAKGDLIAVARLAGIQAAKRTADLIPLCHPLPLEHVEVDLEVGAEAVVITALCRTTGRTGVEMEALTAVAVAALSVYDMAKAVDRGMRIAAVELVEKHGGASGSWRREEL
jgi:cyclic pyranopterin phosphate synthase